MKGPSAPAFPVPRALSPSHQRVGPPLGGAGAAVLGYPVLKRLLDVVLCLLALPVVLPVLLLCGAAVRLDSPGPIVFSQLRTGRHGRRFRIYKFRTMCRDAEEQKAGLAHLNILPPPDFKIIDDPRITRAGRFLRATSLDEVPQLWNVLCGDMTLVGPRPTSFTASTYDLWHTARLEVRPGLTGLWQVHGRNRSDFDERLRMDIEYIRTMCLRRDVMLIVQTVSSVAHRRGA